MKFVHCADCHIGGWKEEKLRNLGMESFRTMISFCISEKIDFLLIAGDLFNTALPQIDLIKETVSELKRLKDQAIPIYMIPGSHDFSPSGKTMLDVFEKAGLIINVSKMQEVDGKINLAFTNHKDIKITGIYGKKGGLEKTFYESLDPSSLEKENGFKIFMFHTALTEFKPKDLESLDSLSVASLPRNFNYYAGGHVHYIFEQLKEGYGLITFPGALFPNNFKELEEFKHGSFFILNLNNGILNHELKKIKLKEVLSLDIDINNLTPIQAQEKIIALIKNSEIKDKIITLRIHGILSSGKKSDINLNEILEQFNEAYIILKNTSKVTMKEFESHDIEIKNIDEVENTLIEKSESNLNIKNMTKEQQSELVKQMMEIFNKEKLEGEKNADFELRILEEANKLL
ncbi:exonuclease SbcCD subunit D [Candidatus Woesearchaeota archaeon]|nr:exonuclease SbcCD subunit D [Candidatus Woesearchaeota archaeon]